MVGESSSEQTVKRMREVHKRVKYYVMVHTVLR